MTLETASERELRRARARRLVALDVALDDERRFLRFDGAGQTENSPPDGARRPATTTSLVSPLTPTLLSDPSRPTVPFSCNWHACLPSVLPFHCPVPLFPSSVSRSLFHRSALPFDAPIPRSNRFDFVSFSFPSSFFRQCDSFTFFKGLLKTTNHLFSNETRRSLTRRDVARGMTRHRETRVTRLYDTENKGMLLVAVHVRIGARMRGNKPCEPRYDSSFVHYDRYVNRRVSSNFPAPHRSSSIYKSRSNPMLKGNFMVDVIYSEILRGIFDA